MRIVWWGFWVVHSAATNCETTQGLLEQHGGNASDALRSVQEKNFINSRFFGRKNHQISLCFIIFDVFSRNLCSKSKSQFF